MSKTTIVVLALVSGLLFPGVTRAASPGTGLYLASDCLPIYGGGETCLPQGKIKVDKKVATPSTKNFVDNLSVSDPKYKAGDTINFQLSITNQGKETLSIIEIQDNLPNFITYTSGPGTFDAKKRTLTFKLNNLKQNETRKFIVKGTVNDILKSTCVVNYVRVKSGAVVADDSSKFCLEKSVCEDNATPAPTSKGGFPVMPAPQQMTQTPATGPEMFTLIGLLPIALAGFYLRKKS